MADDIVKRLRDAEWESVLYELAADEIERLRRINAILQKAEVTRALEAVDYEQNRDRLRAALERIANWQSGDVSALVIARDALTGDAKPETQCGCMASCAVDMGATLGYGFQCRKHGRSLPASDAHTIEESNARSAFEGHGYRCHMCGNAMDSLAANPGRWPAARIAPPNREGFTYWHCVDCVTRALYPQGAANQPSAGQVKP